MKAVAKRNRTLDSIGQMTRKALTAGKDRRRVGRASHREASAMAKVIRPLSGFDSRRPANHNFFSNMKTREQLEKIIRDEIASIESLRSEDERIWSMRRIGGGSARSRCET